MSATMKSLAISPDGTGTISEIPIPKPGPHEVLIKVAVAGSNPKDWKMPLWSNKSSNTGDDLAGVVEEVGEGVYEVQKGDRVMAYRWYLNPAGSYAEYALAFDFMTVKIPEKVSFEEVATIPLAYMTAVIGLYNKLRLPFPWAPPTKPTPLVVYGAATAVGAFTIKLARLSNIHPIIGVVGRGKDFAEKLIDRSKGDELVDYRNGNEALVNGILAALKKNGFEKADYVFDTVSEHGSVVNSLAVLSEKGLITGVLPLNLDPKAKDLDPKSIPWKMTSVGYAFETEWDDGTEEKKLGLPPSTAGRELSYVFMRWAVRGLNEGWFTGHPYEVVKGGLRGVEDGLRRLKEGKTSAVKFVARIAETE
ncbi:Zeta-crystallin [Arthrobotrys entomopaga]|nr:Zeta-crystallin [Arthrobotrys entomopaga]